jgi:hypothetical protein
VVDIVVVEESQVRRSRGAGREGYGGIRHGLAGWTAVVIGSSRLSWACLASFKGRGGPRDDQSIYTQGNPAVENELAVPGGGIPAQLNRAELKHMCTLVTAKEASTAISWP